MARFRAVNHRLLRFVALSSLASAPYCFRLLWPGMAAIADSPDFQISYIYCEVGFSWRKPS